MEKLKLFLWTIAIVILGVVIGTFFIGKGEKEKKIIRVMNVNDLSGAPILVMENDYLTVVAIPPSTVEIIQVSLNQDSLIQLFVIGSVFHHISQFLLKLFVSGSG